MTQIVWIASYPRSGNTWLRFLLANLLVGKVERSMDVTNAVPDIHRFLTGRHLLGPARSFIKTHWAWRSDFPLRGNTEAAVYVLRNPIDVAESALNYAARHRTARSERTAGGADNLQRFAREFVAGFTTHGGNGAWYRQGFGTWSENVASWTETALPFRRHVVRYEALRADPVRELAGIARFLELPATPDQIAEAVAHASLARMREIEERELEAGTPGFFYDPQFATEAVKEFRFVGGKDGRPLALTDEERARLHERFAPAMAKLGYD